MNRRNIITTGILAASTLLMVGGITLAREAERHDDRRIPVLATQPPALTDDNGGTIEMPTASPDDHGGSRGGGSDDAARPTASPDDHGGSRGGGSDDGS